MFDIDQIYADGMPSWPTSHYFSKTPTGEHMADVLVGAGFRFVSIHNSTKAMSTIVTTNLALIFLDLVIFGSSSYEICSKIRKILRFQQTPIQIQFLGLQNTLTTFLGQF